MKEYDIIVVGGGHAGSEAARVSARTGNMTLLITMKKAHIGALSCNPAIGGLGKGQLVKEIDALGGLMGKAADYSGIQFRRLNTSKGAAVRSCRAQVDREYYKKYVQSSLFKENNLYIKEGIVTEIILQNGKISGIKLNNDKEIFCGALIITTGTFLGGVIHMGLKSFSGGRIGEQSSVKLSQSLKELGFKMRRFKTGTCPRLIGTSIDFSELTVQTGDKTPVPFSYKGPKLTDKQLPCYITHTNETTHKIIRDNFKKSPLYTGVIKGRGVRYCPSIEDKLLKFSGIKRHQIFLEPETKEENIYYPNGVSTSLPCDVQKKFLRSIKGLENVKISRYGYGIEYDVIDSRSLFPTLQSKNIENLYIAGQINGTTGYEEAAAQGLIAGTNASAKIKGKEPLILERYQAYIGVLIDDLVTKGVSEPYRMFTSRAEYRLILREDNARIRLSEIGFKHCGLSEKNYKELLDFKKKFDESRKIIQNIKVIDKDIFVSNYLKNPLTHWDDIISFFPDLNIPTEVGYALDIEIKYDGYIKKQDKEIKRLQSMDNWNIPDDIDYRKIGGLSREVVEKLQEIKPLQLGQASRIPGITPAAITNIMIYIRANEQ